MRIETLDLKEFIDKSHELAEAVENKYGAWRCVVGIASGGQWVAKAFEREGAEMLTVVSQRQSTKWKRRFADRVISILPVRICNWLRIIEAKASTRNRQNTNYLPSLEISQRLEAINHEGTNGRKPLIIVVDDAADSGNTLKGAVTAVRNYAPDCAVITAVISATQAGGNDAADIALWRQGVLVRFPWAPDASAEVREEFKEWSRKISEK